MTWRPHCIRQEAGAALSCRPGHPSCQGICNPRPTPWVALLAGEKQTCVRPWCCTSRTKPGRLLQGAHRSLIPGYCSHACNTSCTCRSTQGREVGALTERTQAVAQARQGLEVQRPMWSVRSQGWLDAFLWWGPCLPASGPCEAPAGAAEACWWGLCSARPMRLARVPRKMLPLACPCAGARCGGCAGGKFISSRQLGGTGSAVAAPQVHMQQCAHSERRCDWHTRS